MEDVLNRSRVEWRWDDEHPADGAEAEHIGILRGGAEFMLEAWHREQGLWAVGGEHGAVPAYDFAVVA